ncbi:MAG: hypothetical protein EOP11_04000 [Proteobacteria bacterium]|nr:MAG: hypothetical protein EOP11_04000 [Pseudomonadota bacterium]
MPSTRNLRALFLAATCILLPGRAMADNFSLSESLKAFEANPKKFMETLPPKDSGGKSMRKFSREDLEKFSFVAQKNKRRPLNGRAKVKRNDQAQSLVDFPASFESNLQTLNKPKLLKGKVAERPWSDYYWALFNGQLANRYAEKAFPNDEDWNKNFRYLQNHPQSSSLETLSPAEKYDLLIGDEAKTLTKLALKDGEDYYREHGKVEDWMGLCHGWAPASYAMPRPSGAIKVLAADGKTTLTFYPADIKALASLLWANHPGETRMVGGRCDIQKAQTDEFGRAKNQDCFDTNPATWHLAVVNQLGMAKRPLIMDSTFDYEVWNFPLVSYEINFFHPGRMTPVKKMEEALIPIAEHTGDRFKKFRAKETAFIVGVSMTVRYAVETEPQAKLSDSSANDKSDGATYLYDLEIDAQGKVIGGEWFMNVHPDFLWTPTPGARALTPGDELLIKEKQAEASWDGRAALPARWLEVARRSSKGGAPLALIVESLIKLSNGPAAMKK